MIELQLIVFTVGYFVKTPGKTITRHGGVHLQALDLGQGRQEVCKFEASLGYTNKATPQLAISIMLLERAFYSSSQGNGLL